MKPQLENLASEIVRTFKYYQVSERKGSEEGIKKFILTGGMSRLFKINRFFGERMMASTDICDPMKTVDIGKDGMDISVLQNDAHKFSVAIGLAMRGKEVS